MTVFTYLTTPNINLLCCICRTPFVQPLTTRTCSHTFCQECIETALSVVQQCPIDRSPLTMNDLIPADPLVRNLVDELEVECPHRADGCEYTCQRQLLASHIEEDCQYEGVPCQDPSCGKLVPRKFQQHDSHSVPARCNTCGLEVSAPDLEKHATSCSAATSSCEACGVDVSATSLKTHQDQCPDVVVPCQQEANGCPWKGSRRHATAHTSSCPYEAIKGFFAVHDRKMSCLTDENAVLRHRLDVLEGVVNSLRSELEVAKAALGPWYRPDNLSRHARQYSSRPQTASSSRRMSQALHNQFGSVVQPVASTSGVATDLEQSAAVAGMHTDAADFASYFPPAEGDAPTTPDAPDVVSVSDYPPFSFAPSPSSPPLMGQQFGPNPRILPLYTYPQIPPLTQSQSVPTPQPTPVAPLNLSTTLEGALASLRDSIVTLSASVDSLGRRQELSATTEAMRTAEDIRSLRAVVHGLRMQVHAVMMDHNAQVTGRAGDGSSSTMGTWLPLETRDPPQWMPGPFVPRNPHPSLAAAPPAITKL